MNKDQFKGNWNVIKGKFKEEWGELTDDQLLAVEGDFDQAVGLIQKQYGIAREEAEKRVKEADEEVERLKRKKQQEENLDEADQGAIQGSTQTGIETIR